MHVVKNDLVEVIAGDEKGKTGKILKALPTQGKIVIEGINYVWKHVRPSQKNPQGGRMQREAPLNISNVLVVCQSRDCQRYNKGVRTRMKIAETGAKVRVCTRCGHTITTGTEK